MFFIFLGFQNRKETRMNKFHNYIDMIGQVELAKSVNVSKQSVFAWRYGISVPKFETAYLLVKKSQGKIGYEDIYNDFCRKKLIAKKAKV